ncbi:Anti-Muellerian hormone type-2 receptor [Quillaja saponaria]|uniref:Anti-Muellerian hormone type-2 receptor n=1 Tax=Quillaja saponaria TaxID=32244 RepID=A0AAD7P6V8_QUISA|nr:Anti-Muellerian hormone type-2 receptor [Quillaja saponaria]
MLLLSPTTGPLCLSLNHLNGTHKRTRLHVPLRILGMAKEGSESGEGIIEKAAIVTGLVSTPVIAWSLYTLKTTGCGLPPGPGGSIGALEGVSYLVVVGIVAWSLYTKTKTGSGLPNGPFGLLGAVEGISYLTLLAIIVVFGLQYFEQGYIPGPLPADQCFG